MKKQIIAFSNYFDHPGVMVESFARSKLRDLKNQGLAAFQDIHLGDARKPIQPKVRAYIGATDMAGRLGWQGVWLGRCLSKDCAGAEMVDPAEPIFMCCSCFNRDFEHQWLGVEFPAERKAIEHVLLLRSGRFRAWFPGETVAQLKEENKAHGFPV